MHYYFVITSFPVISLKQPPDISFEDLRGLLRLNLTASDQKIVDDFLHYIDLKNLKAFWLEEPLDPRGTLNEKEIDEALLVGDILPDYLQDFLEKYETKEDRLRYFSFLYTEFFLDMISKYKGFMHFYFSFERQMHLYLAAIRAKIFNRDIVKELQFEDPTDSTIAYILSQKDMDDFDPPKEFENLKIFVRDYMDKPKEMYRNILQFRLQAIEEMESEKIFTVDQILGFMARLILIEDWHRLDDEKGKTIVDSIA